MNRYSAERIRNVAFLSHSGAGKTTLVEALLYLAKAIPRMGRTADGNTASDFEPEEIRRRISISLALCPCETAQGKLNLIDLPGYPDFLGEVKAGLRVADGAVLLLDAAAGVEVGAELSWGYLQQAGLPCLIFCNKMDRENADFLAVLAQVRRLFGRHCVALQLPVGAQADFRGVVDLATLQAHFRQGETGPLPEELREAAEALREQLLEAIVETDDDLLAKYLEGATLSQEEIRQAIRTGVSRGTLVPVLAGSAFLTLGVEPLLQALFDCLPSPAERPPVEATVPQGGDLLTLRSAEEGPLAALVFKTTADPYVGKLTYFRVLSGLLHGDSHLWNATRGRPERIGQLYLVRGKAQEPVEALPAGDLGAVARLTETATGDTLCARERPLLLPELSFPVPVFGQAVHPKAKADLDKMGAALTRIVEEDPTLALHRDADTREVTLWGLGELHVEVAVERMRRKFGAEVLLELPKVPYRETITRKTQAEYRHRKQTGGHGQYGHVFLELEPLPRGEGYRFEERIVGGAVPRQYFPGTEKGALEALQEGVVAGYPVVDLKVVLFGGSFHSVDSSDISFQIAASHATRKGLQQAGSVLLEPAYRLRVTIPDAFVGDLLSELSGKRARVSSTLPGGGLTVIEALVPQAELLRFVVELRAMTQGRGTFTMEFSHYDEVPDHVAQRLVAEAKKASS